MANYIIFYNVIYIKVIKNVFDNLKDDLRDTKYEVERVEYRKKRENFVDLFYIFEKNRKTIYL